LSSLGLRGPPMGKKHRLPTHYALQPMPRWMVMSPQSLVFPGWGNSSISGGPYWLFGFAGYGCVAGSVMFNKQSYQSLEDYRVSLDINERDQLFSDAESQNQLSTILMAGAAAIWVTDITILLIKGNKTSNLTYHQNEAGPKLGYTIDPISKSPLMTFKITF